MWALAHQGQARRRECGGAVLGARVAGDGMSERLTPWTQIQFLCPRAATLGVQMPVTVGDGVDLQQSVRARIVDALGRCAAQSLAVDTSVDHDVRDMDAARPEFAREALG